MGWWWLMVAAYVLLQVVAIAQARGRERWIAAGPLVVMVPTAVYAAVGLAMGLNMSPLPFVLATQMSLLYVAVAAVVARRETVMQR